MIVTPGSGQSNNAFQGVLVGDYVQVGTLPLGSGTGSMEIMKVTAIGLGASYTVQRAQQGTAAVAHNSGEPVWSGRSLIGGGRGTGGSAWSLVEYA